MENSEIWKRIKEKEEKERLARMQADHDWLIKAYEKLKVENLQFHDDLMKDEVIQKITTELKETREELDKLRRKEYEHNDFSFNEEELAEADKWITEHYAANHSTGYGGVSGGSYSFIIIPTGLGIIKEVKCNCGASHTIQDLM